MTLDPYDDLDLKQLTARKSAKWSMYPSDVIPAFVAEMDFHLAPSIARILSRAIDAADLGYPAPLDKTGMGEVFAAWAAREYGWKVDPGVVTIAPDVVKAIQIVLEAATQPGDGVVIQPPVYPPFFSLVPHVERKLIQSPLTDSGGAYEIDLDRLDADLKGARVLLLCNPQNPTGRSFSRTELQAVAQLALKHDVLVISDEIHAPLTYPGSRHTVFASLGEEVARTTVTVTAASKAWNFGGLKCGLIVADSPRVARLVADLPYLSLSGASILGIEATKAAFEDGKEWMDQTVSYLDGNRDWVGRLLAQSGLPIGYRRPEATYLAWLDCRPLGLEDPYAHFLDKARVAFSNGRMFGAEGAGFVRFNLATSRAILQEIVQRVVASV